ncbi:hypothetical protein EDF60_0230 [Leucobacter luti]|nr:hypothetical protein [Leucobacter luti]TCK45011.1 hypothetical protein EDF60_0230 [Leucobacter luti]
MGLSKQFEDEIGVSAGQDQGPVRVNPDSSNDSTGSESKT